MSLVMVFLILMVMAKDPNKSYLVIGFRLNLRDIIMYYSQNFGLHRFVFTAYIRDMYRQIRVISIDAHIWRELCTISIIKLAADTIKKCTYVNDICTGHSSIEKVQELQSQHSFAR